MFRSLQEQQEVYSLKFKKMKRKIFLIAASILMLPAWLAGQNMDDALRYSRLFYQGTARFNGMSGAFTALGGDVSAIGLNPRSGRRLPLNRSINHSRCLLPRPEH